MSLSYVELLGILQCNLYKDWVPPIKKIYSVENLKNQWKREIKRDQKYEEELALLLNGKPQKLWSRLNNDIRGYYLESMNLVKDINPDYYSKIMKSYVKFTLIFYFYSEIHEQLSRKENIMDQEVKRANENRDLKISEVKKNLKNNKNFKNGRRQRDNKRFKKLDPKAFKTIFIEDKLGLSHENKKIEFYKAISPNKRRIFRKWQGNGWNMPIDIREQPVSHFFDFVIFFYRLVGKHLKI